jgi:hypothetical protein
VAATQTTIDLAKFILSAGVIDFARFNAIFGLDGKAADLPVVPPGKLELGRFSEAFSHWSIQ